MNTHDIVFTDEQKKFISLMEISPEYTELKKYYIECSKCGFNMVMPLVISTESIKIVNDIIDRIQRFYMKEGMI